MFSKHCVLLCMSRRNVEMRTFEEYRKIVEENLYNYLPPIDERSKTVDEAMRYSLGAGGKRLRPILVLAACEFVGGNIEDAMPHAMAMEYIHTYSLIHDDLPCVDNDDLRRGKPTSHKMFGEAMAVLAGDGLLNSAFDAMMGNVAQVDKVDYFSQTKREKLGKDASMMYISPILYLLDDAGKKENREIAERQLKVFKGKILATKEISKVAGVQGMIAGQVADIEAEGKAISLGHLQYIHANKTGAMIVGAIKAGAYIGGANVGLLNVLTKYAENLGLAFQIRDDLLDVIGTTEELGKNVGHDEETDKATYPAIVGIEKTEETLEIVNNCAKEILEPYGDKAKFFNDLVDMMAVRRT